MYSVIVLFEMHVHVYLDSNRNRQVVFGWIALGLLICINVIFFISAKTGTTDSKIKTFLKGLKCRKSNDGLFT
jgi:hypothetical protein